MTSYMRLPPWFAVPRSISGRARAGRSIMGVAILCLALLSATPASMAQIPVAGDNVVASEERVKAAYLYRFLSYVEWPSAVFPRADAAYVIGIVNADDVAEELMKVAAGRNVNNRPVTIRKLQVGDQLNGTHLLFIGKTERTRQRQLLKQWQARPVLLVTESEGALSQGSMINFRLVDDRVRFEISLDPVEKSGLKINSRMFSVAISVTKEPQQ
jgi:hypothetical protein